VSFVSLIDREGRCIVKCGQFQVKIYQLLSGRFALIFFFSFELCKTKTNQKSRVYEKSRGFSKFSENRILLETNIWNFNHP